jgi:hypothetical protein
VIFEAEIGGGFRKNRAAHGAKTVLGGIPKRILRNSFVTCFRL